MQDNYELHQYCMNCQADLTMQKGFDPTAYYWECRGCGMVMLNPELAESDILWQCDECGDVLNLQEGFSEENDEWACRKCGFVNSLDASSIFSSEEEFRKYDDRPTKGMSDQDILEIDLYDEIKSLSGHENVILVESLEDNKIYVKKILMKNDVSLFKYLMEHPIEHMPGIIGIYEGRDKLVLIEEYIEGQTLENQIFDTEEALELACRIYRIVMDLHQAPRPIIHRDIKPSNIIISKENDVYLLDMDAAKWYDSEKNEDTVLMGTRYYAAPEQYGLTDFSSSEKTDVYALGSLLNVLITGEDTKHARAMGPVWEIIEKCRQLNPEDRYSDEELMEALENLRKKYNEG